ncbi:MAG TPA: hypothetical protein VL285_19120 [Bryobacteraceae bacterium]|nr:hypothetical protein [Bryobacteraceae bacterium]
MPPPEWNSPPALASSPFIGLPVAPPPKSALPAPSRPARTGSFIWTGMLSKSAVLSIEGNRASTGALTGAIPEYPVKVRVYPAELTDAGLKVYSSDQRHPGGSSELPAAHNGWNKTSYIQDSRLGGVVSVLEAPNPRNNWRRLVLRDNGARLSIILIEWEML